MVPLDHVCCRFHCRPNSLCRRLCVVVILVIVIVATWPIIGFEVSTFIDIGVSDLVYIHMTECKWN